MRLRPYLWYLCVSPQPYSFSASPVSQRRWGGGGAGGRWSTKHPKPVLSQLLCRCSSGGLVSHRIWEGLTPIVSVSSSEMQKEAYFNSLLQV